MKHQVPHDLGQERAKQVAEKAFESYTAKFAEYQPKVTWKDARTAQIAFNVKGLSLTGCLEVNPTDITMDLDVPFLLRPFKGTALAVIEQEIREWIGKAKAGSL